MQQAAMLSMGGWGASGWPSPTRGDPLPPSGLTVISGAAWIPVSPEGRAPPEPKCLDSTSYPNGSSSCNQATRTGSHAGRRGPGVVRSHPGGGPSGPPGEPLRGAGPLASGSHVGPGSSYRLTVGRQGPVGMRRLGGLCGHTPALGERLCAASSLAADVTCPCGRWSALKGGRLPAQGPRTLRAAGVCRLVEEHRGHRGPAASCS